MKWKLVRLADLCEINVGKTPSRDRQDFFGKGGTWVSIADMNDKIYIDNSKEQVTPDGIKSANMKLVDTHTVLFSFKLSVGKVCITAKPLYTNEAIAALPIKNVDALSTKYLYYAMQAQDFSHLGERAAKGLTLNKEKLKRIEIPLPTLAIQQKLAVILGEADALHRMDRALLAKYDELMQAVFYDMFGDPVKNEKGWEVKKLNELCNKITDGTHFSPPMSDTGIPYITAKHLKPFKVDFYANPTYISQDEHEKIYSRCTPEKGDVLYIKDGATTGIAAINEYAFEFSMLSSLALIKPKTSILNNCFLVAYLNHPIVKQKLILNSMAGAAIQRFTLSKINSFECIVPPIELQDEFSIIFKSILAQKSQIIQQQTYSKNLFQSLMQRAFKGELVQ